MSMKSRIDGAAVGSRVNDIVFRIVKIILV